MQKAISLQEITYPANYWWSAHTEWHHPCTMPICGGVKKTQYSNMKAYSPFWGGSLFCTKSNKDTFPEGLGGATVSSSLSPRFLLSRSSAPFDFGSARKRSLSRWPSSRLTPSCFYTQNTPLHQALYQCLLTRDSFSWNVHQRQNKLLMCIQSNTKYNCWYNTLVRRHVLAQNIAIFRPYMNTSHHHITQHGTPDTNVSVFSPHCWILMDDHQEPSKSTKYTPHGFIVIFNVFNTIYNF
jgi:hypothetical protein